MEGLGTRLVIPRISPCDMYQGTKAKAAKGGAYLQDTTILKWTTGPTTVTLQTVNQKAVYMNIIIWLGFLFSL